MGFNVGQRVRVLRIPGVELETEGCTAVVVNVPSNGGYSARMSQPHVVEGGLHWANTVWWFDDGDIVQLGDAVCGAVSVDANGSPVEEE